MLATICHVQDMSQGLSHDGNMHKLHVSPMCEM